MDYNILQDAGFIDVEIKAFSEAKDPEGKDQPPLNLDTPVWQQVLQSRRNWLDKQLESGKTYEEIRNQITYYYRAGRHRSPFDFLKAEYKPPAKVDYHAGLERRRSRRVTKKL